MKKNIPFIVLFVMIIVIVVAIVSGNKPSPSSNGKPVVGATIFPIGDIVKQVAGDKIDVKVLLPPGASPHTFEIRPSDLRELQKVDKLFIVGHGLDAWAGNLTDGIEGIELVEVDRGISLRPFAEEEEHHQEDEHHEDGEHEHGEIDPHYWLSASNVAIITETVRDELIELYPQHKQTFIENTSKYLVDLKETDDYIKHLIGPIEDAEIIVFHDSWRYFANDYFLEIVGVFEPAPGREPSPQYLKDLHDTAKLNTISQIFTEPQLASDTVEPFIKDLGLDIIVIDPLGGIGERNSYINLMRYNADTIYNALKTNN